MFLGKIKSKSTNELIRKFVQNEEMENLSDAYGKSFRRLTVYLLEFISNFLISQISKIYYKYMDLGEAFDAQFIIFV